MRRHGVAAAVAAACRKAAARSATRRAGCNLGYLVLRDWNGREADVDGSAMACPAQAAWEVTPARALLLLAQGHAVGPIALRC